MSGRAIRGHRSLTAGLALAVVVAACGSGTGVLSPTASAGPPGPSETGSSQPGGSAGPTTSPDLSELEIYSKIEAQIESIRQLQHDRTVTPVLLDSKGVAAELARLNASQTDHKALADEGELFIHLGMLQKGSSLEQLELSLEDSQVVGFYDSVSKGLYVLSESGGVGAMEKLTFSHEYTHALQDQNFGLEKLATDTPDQGDRDLAHIALPEGDATLAMTQWATKNMSLADLIGITSGSAQQQQQFDAAPAILRNDLTFPYEQGLAFVQYVYARGGWASVDAVYSDPPESTSQILHPELYDQHVKPATVRVPPVPASMAGWKLEFQDTLGEFQLGVWLSGDSSDGVAASAADAVSEWGGDRIGLYQNDAGGWAVVLETSWRSEAGAKAFAAAAGKVLTPLGSPSRTCSGPTTVEITIASAAGLLPPLASCTS
jgi:hypothetical protein